MWVRAYLKPALALPHPTRYIAARQNIFQRETNIGLHGGLGMTTDGCSMACFPVGSNVCVPTAN